MSLNDQERDEFRRLPKRIPAPARAKWRERNLGTNVQVARLPIHDALDLQVGEVALVWGGLRRVPFWKFHLKRQRVEVDAENGYPEPPAFQPEIGF